MQTLKTLIDPSALWRRFRNGFRTVLARGDLATLVIACLLIVIPVLALSSSLNFSREATSRVVTTWPVSMNQLIPVAILSVVFGFILARSQYSEGLALLLSAIYSLGTTLVIQVIVAPGSLITRVIEVSVRLAYSFKVTFSGGGFDPFFLIVFLSLLVWFLGHNTAWHIFRLDRVWRAILPPGIVLILNNFYNFQATNLDSYLITYVFLALLLIVRSHIEAREYDWYMHRVRFEGGLRDWFFRGGAILGMLMLIFSWVMPTGAADQNAQKFQQFLNGDLIKHVQDLMNRLLAPLEGPGVVTTDYYGGDTLKLGGAIRLGNDPVMYVSVDQPATRYYWKSRVFDTYNAGEWTAERGSRLDGNQLVLQYPPTDPKLRTNVTQQFTMAISTSRLIYAAPQPIEIDLPSEAEIDFVGNTKADDPAVIRPNDPIPASQPYQAVSSVTIATAGDLRADQGPYPDWTQRYLQLPNTITSRTVSLANDIVKGATTNYDKAKAIETWLRQNMKYNETITLPPDGSEPVDWFLFTAKSGYCTYYASSMIVMLRELHIPARMAAGFAQGQATTSGSLTEFTVRERDAHTWVEVYFPQAGWVEFEPTSSQQSLDRPDPRSQASTPTPSVSPTPSPSPSPTPTLTPTRSSGQVNPPPQSTLQPSITPSAQATYTATPAPSPAPIIPPPSSAVGRFTRGLLWLLLIAAGTLFIGSFVLTSVLWWVEYRGLDKLSPTGRAYARLAIYARWLRIPLGDANTPLERGRRIAKVMPNGSRSVTSLTDLYIAERYSPPRAGRTRPVDEEGRAQNLWQTARRAFIESKIKKWFRRE